MNIWAENMFTKTQKKPQIESCPLMFITDRNYGSNTHNCSGKDKSSFAKDT